MRTKQRNNLAETARHERVAQNTDVYAVKARNYKGLRRGSPVLCRDEHYMRYQTGMSPLLDEEVDKLIALQERHKEYYQMTLFEHERKLQEQERRVDELFEQLMNWVKETLTIQNNPYIRVVSVLMGVSQ